MATITGKTFEHRETLKAYGAKFNSVEKYWTVDDSQAEAIKALNLAAVIVTVDASAPKVEPLPPAPTVAPTFPVENGTQMVGDDMTYHNAFRLQNPSQFAGFSSLVAMVDLVKSLPRKGDHWIANEPDFYGVSMSEALSFATNGWSAGVDEAQKVVDLFNAEHAERLTRAYGVAGGRVNVGRLMAGNPMHMSRRQRAPGRRVVTLFVANGMQAVIKPRTALIRAACVAAIADLLEIAGYSCEIVGVSHVVRSSDEKPYSQIAVTLKHAGEALNLSDVVFGLGHPAMHRRLNFAVKHISPNRTDMFRTVPAFGKTHVPPPNSFFISQPTETMQEAMRVAGRDLASKARALFPFIVPADLPVKLTA